MLTSSWKSLRTVDSSAISGEQSALRALGRLSVIRPTESLAPVLVTIRYSCLASAARKARGGGGVIPERGEREAGGNKPGAEGQYRSAERSKPHMMRATREYNTCVHQGAGTGAPPCQQTRRLIKLGAEVY